jgi:hypothetical protein
MWEGHQEGGAEGEDEVGEASSRQILQGMAGGVYFKHDGKFI